MTSRWAARARTWAAALAIGVRRRAGLGLGTWLALSLLLAPSLLGTSRTGPSFMGEPFVDIPSRIVPAPGAAAPAAARERGTGSPQVPTASTAPPDLTITSAARYDVQPDARRVHISVDAVATNHRTDTVTRRFYFDSGYLAVLPGTSHFVASATGASPTVAIKKKTADYTLLAISFGRRVWSGQSSSFRLQFDLADPGGSPTRDVRISPSLVAFPVWAFATDMTPNASVAVAFPSGYSIQLDAGQLAGPQALSDGRELYQSGPLAKPLDFFAYFVADRPGAYAERPVSARVGGEAVRIMIRPWTDDPAWGKRVGDLFVKGLPVLSQSIGLPYPKNAPLIVQESVSRTIGGYAGLFDPATGTIQVAYYADPFVVLHEAAHSWFNGSLLADRWMNEAFASYYAAQAAARLKLKITPQRLTPVLERSRIPLNAWGAVGREDASVEDYAYAATQQLAGLIGKRVGPSGLQSVWRAAATGEAAYQPIQPGRPVEQAGGGAPDWRGTLDLVQERTGVDLTDLWASWVVRPEERQLLDDREAARAAYATATSEAGDWELPPSIRTAMDAWRFEPAEALIKQADAVLTERPKLEQSAREAGLTLPPTLRAAFEGPNGPDAAAIEEQAESVAVAAVADAASAAVQQSDPFQTLGLWGTDPGADLAAARSAFVAGDLELAERLAGQAKSTWLAAADNGRRTAAVGGLLVVAVFLVIWRPVRRRRGQEA